MQMQKKKKVFPRYKNSELALINILTIIVVAIHATFRISSIFELHAQNK